MAFEKIKQEDIRNYISTLLQNHFGEKPQAMDIIFSPSFIVIHLKGFLMPSEKIFMKRNEEKRILETRDILVNRLKTEVIQDLRKITGQAVVELYADWNLKKETGMLFAVMEEGTLEDNYRWPEEVDKMALREIMIDLSRKTQKAPGQTELYWLAKDVVMVERIEIMVDIEKELIKNGVIEELRLAKRPLEYRVSESSQMEQILKRKISEVFVDWNFENDKAYLVLVLEPSRNSQ